MQYSNSCFIAVKSYDKLKYAHYRIMASDRNACYTGMPIHATLRINDALSYDIFQTSVLEIMLYLHNIITMTSTVNKA